MVHKRVSSTSADQILSMIYGNAYGNQGTRQGILLLFISSKLEDQMPRLFDWRRRRMRFLI